MAIFERSEKEPVKYAFIYLTFLKKAMEQNIIIKDKAISFILVDGVEYFNLTEIGTLDEELRDDLVR